LRNRRRISAAQARDEQHSPNLEIYAQRLRL